MGRGRRWALIVLTGTLAAALLFAGIAKLIHPEDFGILRLLGGSNPDPRWMSHAVSIVEIAAAAALLAGRPVGRVAVVALTLGFVVYHVGFGLGLSAPT